MSDDKCRLSLTGWFHSNSSHISCETNQSSLVGNDINFTPLNPYDDSSLIDNIHKNYLTAEIVEDICTEFENESAMELPNFLNLEFVNRLRTHLINDQLIWIHKGPLNIRSYYELNEPEKLNNDFSFFVSSSFAKIISRLTNLGPENYDDSEYIPFDTQLVGVNLRILKFIPGSYSLLHGLNNESTPSPNKCSYLDVWLFVFPIENYKLETTQYDGGIHYVENGEKQEILNIEPVDNACSVVYYFEDVQYFIKRLSSLMSNMEICHFFAIKVSYELKQ